MPLLAIYLCAAALIMRAQMLLRFISGTASVRVRPCNIDARH